MENDASSYKKVIGVAIGITILLTLLVLLQYRQLSNRPGTIIIPAGNTYLGSRATPTPSTGVRTIQGHIYPYVFEIPQELNLTTFPDDPYDMYALAGADPSSHVLIGIDDLSKNTDKSMYISQPKTAYINTWWKQFGGLTGVKTIQPFTNSQGLKGYSVIYTTSSGQSSNLDIFFEVPNHPEYVIHLANGVLDSTVFSKIVDSVSWK